MGRVRERLDSLKVRALSGDGRIQARLHGRDNVDLVFRDGVYRRYADVELAAQLTQAATRLTEGCRDGRRAAIRAATGVEFDDKPHWNAKERRFLAARDSIEAFGASANDRVRIGTRGRRDWQIRVKPGTVAALDETQFKAHVHVAVGRLLLDYRRRLAELRERYR